MVNKLTKADEAAIGDVIEKIERKTAAKISVIVLPFSDHYRDFGLLYGFILGSIVSFALWVNKVTAFPLLLAVQLGVIILVGAIPWLRHLCIRLTPRRIRHHRASKVAHREYLAIHADMPKGEPFVLLFVSLAECYVHVVTNPVVHKKIPKNWDAVTGHFITSVRKEGLRTACIQTLGHMAEILTPHFPKR